MASIFSHIVITEFVLQLFFCVVKLSTFLAIKLTKLHHIVKENWENVEVNMLVKLADHLADINKYHLS